MMAITDHTQRSRPSLWTDPQPTPNLGRTRHLMATAEEPQQHRATALAGIAFANQSIVNLLDDTNAYRDAHI